MFHSIFPPVVSDGTRSGGNGESTVAGDEKDEWSS